MRTRQAGSPHGALRAANHTTITSSFADTLDSIKNNCQQSTPVFNISFHSPVNIYFFPIHLKD